MESPQSITSASKTTVSKIKLGGLHEHHPNISTNPLHSVNLDEDDRYSISMVRTNSFANSVFLMLNAMIGSGIFNQPEVYAMAGIWQSVLMSAVAAFFIWVGLIVLVETGIKVNKFDFASLAEFAFGNAGMLIAEFFIFLYNFGANLSYLTVIAQSFSDMLFAWGCENEVGCGPYLWSVLLTAIFVFPLCIQKYFGNLSFISTFSIATMSIAVLFILIGAPIVSHNRDYDFGSSAGFASKMGSIIFAFTCSFGALPTYQTMANKSLAAWSHVSSVTLIVGFALNFAVGLVCSLSFGKNTEGYILDSFHGDYSYIFKLIVIVQLILHITPGLILMRSSFLKICGVKKGQLDNYHHHVFVTFFLLTVLLVSASATLASRDSQSVSFGRTLDLTGGVAATATSFIIPGAVYLKVMPTNSKYYISSGLMCLFGLIVLVAVPFFI